MLSGLGGNYKNWMHLLSRDHQEDVQTITAIAEQIATVWELGRGADYGFKVVYFPETIRLCSLRAAQVMNERQFSESPGPFKRVAALAVFAKLFHIFGLANPGHRRGEDFTQAVLPPKLYNQWAARVAALFIPATLPVLQLEIPRHADLQPDIIPLNAPFDYPSAHFKLEVLQFLEWLENNFPPLDQEWDEQSVQRMSRIILGMALIIEASYYFSEDGPHPEKSHHIRGKCSSLHHSDLTGVNYDKYILENWQKAEIPPDPAADV